MIGCTSTLPSVSDGRNNGWKVPLPIKEQRVVTRSVLWQFVMVFHTYLLSFRLHLEDDSEMFHCLSMKNHSGLLVT